MRVLAKIHSVKMQLQTAGINDAERDAELIASSCLGMNRTFFYRDNPIIPADIAAEIDAKVQRRLKREPLQYILGYVDFYGLKIHVGPGVLIPRPETELLAEEAIRAIIKNNAKLNILDLCTGSGCLALALAMAFPDSMVYGTDSEETAISYAEENAKTNIIRNVRFLKGSLFEPLEKRIASTEDRLSFDIIVSNPPYINRDDLKKLQPEIKNWEPLSALDGGEDGLDFYREIIPGAKRYLTANGILLFELGIHQAEPVKQMAEDAGFRNISGKKDYAGIERIFIARA
jgi:release factor glutamine methyltransferase